MIYENIKLSEENDKVELRTYVIDPNLVMIGKHLRPAVLVLGGGAYFSVSDPEGEPVALAFNAMGYHAFCLKYSTYGADAYLKGLENLDRREKTEHPAPIRDVARAILYIKDHAEEWNVDPDRIAVCGFSAGGHNAAMYVTNWNQPVLTDYFKRPAEDFRVAAGILCYPLTDYNYMKNAVKQGITDSASFEASNIAFLGCPNPMDDTLTEVSPAQHVTKNTPPCFIWTTSADRMVPPQNSLLMALALQNAEVPYELYISQDGDHGLSIANQLSAASKEQIRPDVNQWVGLVENWLIKRFAVDMPDTFSFGDFDAEIALE